MKILKSACSLVLTLLIVFSCKTEFFAQTLTKQKKSDTTTLKKGRPYGISNEIIFSKNPGSVPGRQTANRIYNPHHKDDSRPRSSFGLGFGLDFGGVGINCIVFPGKHVGVFGSVGYALAGVGYNFGLKLRTRPVAKGSSFYFLAMYGYNAAVDVTNNTSLSKVFYGPTFGIGVDFSNGRVGYWSLGLLLPIRSPDVDNYLNTYNVSIPPVAVSIGYHFMRKD